MIDALVEDLVPLRRAASLTSALALLIPTAWVLVTGAIVATGPLREGAIESLIDAPRFCAEFVLAMLAGASALAAGLEFGVPGAPYKNRLVVLSVVLFCGWIGLLAYSVVEPATPPSALGMRPMCNLQTAAYAIPPFVLALYLIRRRALYARLASGALAGIGAATIPAAVMQLACMYDPLHTLPSHVAPIAVVGVLGSFVTWSVQRHR